MPYYFNISYSKYTVFRMQFMIVRTSTSWTNIRVENLWIWTVCFKTLKSSHIYIWYQKLSLICHFAGLQSAIWYVPEMATLAEWSIELEYLSNCNHCGCRPKDFHVCERYKYQWDMICTLAEGCLQYPCTYKHVSWWTLFVCTTVLLKYISIIPGNKTTVLHFYKSIVWSTCQY